MRRSQFATSRVTFPTHAALAGLQAALLLVAATLVAGCATTGGASMSDATNAYNAAEYGRSLGLARAALSDAEGLARDQARYLEGLSLLRLGRFDEAVAPLTDASDAANRTLAADARISLGTALVRRGDLARAAEAYGRAAAILEGDEKQRALAIESDCRARLAERNAPARPAVAVAEPSPPPSPPPSSASAGPSSPTARMINGVEIEPVRFAIQAGAFMDSTKARELAGQLAPQVAFQRLSPPRVIEKPRPDGTSVHVVQFGSFANRAVAGQALRAFPKTVYTVERWVE
jgi:tetratricopeptide (TPR) repeat protein